MASYRYGTTEQNPSKSRKLPAIPRYPSDRWQCINCREIEGVPVFKGCDKHRSQPVGRKICKTCETQVFFLTNDSLSSATCPECDECTFEPPIKYIL